MVATYEVWGLFSHLVPRESLTVEEVAKQRQVMIPDFRVQFTTENRQTETKLAELKFTCGKDLYKPGVRQRQFQKAVDKRAGKLMGEYQEKAEKMDRLLGEVGQGRVRRRLDQFGDLVGLVVGRFNEGSKDVHELLEKMAVSRVDLLARRDGRELSDQEKGVVVGQLRRQLSTAALRAASNCLLDRMHQCGEGASLAAKRREVNVLLEERMSREREIQWLAKLRGGQVIQRGSFLVD